MGIRSAWWGDQDRSGGCLTTVSATRLSVSIGLGQPRVTSLAVVVLRGRTATFVVYSRIVTRFYVPCLSFCSFFPFFFFFFFLFIFLHLLGSMGHAPVSLQTSKQNRQEKYRRSLSRREFDNFPVVSHHPYLE